MILRRDVRFRVRGLVTVSSVQSPMHGTTFNSLPFDDTPILTEDPEGNMVRSVQIHPLISVITILIHRNQGALFSRVCGSITPVAVSPSPLPI